MNLRKDHYRSFPAPFFAHRASVCVCPVPFFLCPGLLARVCVYSLFRPSRAGRCDAYAHTGRSCGSGFSVVDVYPGLRRCPVAPRSLASVCRGGSRAAWGVAHFRVGRCERCCVLDWGSGFARVRRARALRSYLWASFRGRVFASVHPISSLASLESPLLISVRFAGSCGALFACEICGCLTLAQLLPMDILALVTMKNAAKCDT